MKRIKELLSEVAKLQGKAVSYDQAIEMGLTSYYDIEYSSSYGGYRVISVLVINGGHMGTFGESSAVNRRSKKEMIDFLEGILFGIEYSLK